MVVYGVRWIEEDDWITNVSSLGLKVFFGVLLACIVLGGHVRRLFFQRHGWSHRLAGALHLGWLLYGAMIMFASSSSYNNSDEAWKCFWYDVVLGVLGTMATLTAARDFPHRHVTNLPGQSGTLSQLATVTQSEMMEHSFYQILNLFHAIYLHYITWIIHPPTPHLLHKLLALLFVTSPWLLRKQFPVHSFSANWKPPLSSSSSKTTKPTTPTTSGMMRSFQFHKTTTTTTTTTFARMETFLYQIKKWQYVFYKHVIFYGVNISVAFAAAPNNHHHDHHTPLPLRYSWRVFWIALNTSYVMEFFLQTLVKRQVLSQTSMIQFQRLLMAVSTLIAIQGVLGTIRPDIPILSIFLNFTHRGHEMTNTLLTASIAALLTHLQQQQHNYYIS